MKIPSSLRRLKKQLASLLVAAVALAVYAVLGPFSTTPPYDPAWVQQGAVLHVLDVGQGSCMLVQSGGANLLIDGGNPGQADEILAYLENQGVSQVDLVIATHPHADHIGSLADLVEALQPAGILMPRIPAALEPESASYQNLCRTIEEEGVPVIYAQPGLQLPLGDQAQLEVLGPAADFLDLNDYSVVTRLDVGAVSFLFPGDAEESAEFVLLQTGADLQADVLVAGHHGSSTSSGEDFLAQVRPALSVISCGQDNAYGHPHKEALERLGKWGPVFRTDQLGTLLLATDGQSIRAYAPTQGQQALLDTAA